MLVKYLLTIVTLHIFFLDDVEAYGADKRINKLLIGFQRIFFCHLVIFCELKDVRLSDFFDSCNEVFRLLLHVFFEPRANSEGTLIVDRHHILLITAADHCKLIY